MGQGDPGSRHSAAVTGRRRLGVRLASIAR
jgi:hypothetical protein